MVAYRQLRLAVFAVALAVSASVCVQAANAAEVYETHLGATGLADNSRPAILGAGTVLTTLEGQSLKVEGQVSGLNAPVTDAHLMRGAGIGIPGAAMPGALAIDPSGKISGSVRLTGDQIAALRAGQIYVQVNSQKSPAPDGHLWGWLLPVHEKAGEDQPQMGRWFLPQGAGLSRNRN